MRGGERALSQQSKQGSQKDQEKDRPCDPLSAPLAPLVRHILIKVDATHPPQIRHLAPSETNPPSQSAPYDIAAPSKCHRLFVVTLTIGATRRHEKAGALFGPRLIDLADDAFV